MTPEQERATWQFRAIAHCRGNQTYIGTLLLSVIGRPAKHPPMWGASGEIDIDGIVWSGFTDRHGNSYARCPVGPVELVIDKFKALADACKLTEAEAQAMFAEVRKWISVDHRALIIGRQHDELSTRH